MNQANRILIDERALALALAKEEFKPGKIIEITHPINQVIFIQGASAQLTIRANTSHWDWRRACREMNAYGKQRKK